MLPTNFRPPTSVILMTKIISNLQLKPKGIISADLWPKLKGTNNFYLIEIVLISLILLNPRFETQVTLIASYFLKKLTNYFIIAWYFCQKVLHNSFIYEAFWDIKVSFLHCNLSPHIPFDVRQFFFSNLYSIWISHVKMREEEAFSKKPTQNSWPGQNCTKWFGLNLMKYLSFWNIFIIHFML